MGSGDDAGAGLRADLVALLTKRGSVSDPRVAAALGQVPRHVFVPAAELAEAYADQAIVTHSRDGVPTSSASQPAVVAAMLEQLQVPVGGSILEIGAGTGYNAALLAELVGSSGRVVTVDINPEVADEARSHLSQAGVANVTVICGDGALGWADGAPYDGIIVTAGVTDLAPAWVAQLRPGARLVAPLSLRGVPQSVALTGTDGHLRSVAVCEAMFMPLTGTMASADRHLPVTGHAGVRVQAFAGRAVDTGVIAAALDDRGPAAAAIGITASSREIFGSLRRWLVFADPDTAQLSYVGSMEGADASGVPAVFEFTRREGTGRASLCILGPAGFAVLDLAAPAVTAEDPVRHRVLELAVRGHGEAEPQVARLAELVRAWDAAGRPGVDRLRIDAYPSASSPPADTDPHPAAATPEPALGATPDPALGATPEPALGATPHPAAATPDPALATPHPAAATPDPALGATPHPAVGPTPHPAAGATPDPAAGATPDPAAGATPDPAAGATPDPATPAVRATLHRAIHTTFTVRFSPAAPP
jgi:protein-L-isoaspartate(D-aspartate) O-methyltransferase